MVFEAGLGSTHTELYLQQIAKAPLIYKYRLLRARSKLI